MKQGMVERGASFLDRFNTREKALLLMMLLMFSIMGLWIVGRGFTGSLDEIDARIEQYDRALRLLQDNQQGFEERLERADEIRALLEGPTLQLHGFIERECVATSVDPPSNYTDNVIPRLDGTLSELETRATINTVDPLPLSRLLHRIATSEELVDLKVIDLQPARGRQGRYRVDLTVSTYRRTEPDG